MAQTPLPQRPDLDPEVAVVETLLPPKPDLDPDRFTDQLRGNRVTSVFTMPEPDGFTIDDTEIQTERGALGVRIIKPTTERSDRSCIFWIHGGGYILGSAFEPDPRLVDWMRELDCVVVSIEYGLAPEHPYPQGLEDCYAGLLWTAAHTEELGISPERIAIGGISAGGGLAAALAILNRDRGGVPVVFQALVYPMLDDRSETPSSGYETSPIWYATINRLAWGAYLGKDHLTADVPIEGAPSRATSQQLQGLPPAWIGVGTVDIFCAEDIAYAAALLEAGVATELHVYPGGFHGFDLLFPQSRIGAAFNRELLEALKRALDS